jgi:hypothetical protein
LGVSSALMLEFDNRRTLGLDLIVGGRWWRGSCSSEDTGQGNRDSRSPRRSGPMVQMLTCVFDSDMIGGTRLLLVFAGLKKG